MWRCTYIHTPTPLKTHARTPEPGADGARDDQPAVGLDHLVLQHRLHEFLWGLVFVRSRLGSVRLAIRYVDFSTPSLPFAPFSFHHPQTPTHPKTPQNTPKSNNITNLGNVVDVAAHDLPGVLRHKALLDGALQRQGKEVGPVKRGAGGFVEEGGDAEDFLLEVVPRGERGVEEAARLVSCVFRVVKTKILSLSVIAFWGVDQANEVFLPPCNFPIYPFIYLVVAPAVGRRGVVVPRGDAQLVVHVPGELGRVIL